MNYNAPRYHEPSPEPDVHPHTGGWYAMQPLAPGEPDYLAPSVDDYNVLRDRMRHGPLNGVRPFAGELSRGFSFAESYFQRIINQEINSADPMTRRRLQVVHDAIRASDTLRLQEHGLDVTNAWLYDIVAGMARYVPFEVELQATPIAGDGFNGTDFGEKNLNHYAPLRSFTMANLILSEVTEMRGIAARPVVPLRDYTNTQGGRRPTNFDTTAYAAFVARSLYEANVTGSHDQPGRDYLLVSERHLLEDAKSLQRVCSNFMPENMYRTDEGLFFRLPEHFIAAVAARFPDMPLREGASLQLTDADGLPARQAVHAVGFRAPRNRYISHLILSEKAALNENLTTFAFLNGAGVIAAQRYNLIAYDSHLLSPSFVAYGIASLLRQKSDELVKNHKGSVPFTQMSATEYFDESYGKGAHGKSEYDIIEEDVAFIPRIHKALAEFVGDRKLKKVALPAYGPFSYLAFLIAPYMADDGQICMYDIAPENLKFAQAWKDGLLPPEYAAEVTKFQTAIYSLCQDERYANCEALAKKHAVIREGDMRDMFADEWEVIGDAFGTCSISEMVSDFYELTERQVEASMSTEEVLVIKLNVIGSKKWLQFPSSPIGWDDPVKACTQAGLKVKDTLSVRPSKPMREGGYSGLHMTVAVRPSGSRMSTKQQRGGTVLYNGD